jgi:hypothetical protein
LSSRFTGLDHQRAVTLLPAPAGFAENFLLADLVAPHVRIAAANAAVITVFRADVAQFDQAPEIHFGSHLLFFHLVGACIELFYLRRIGQSEHSYQFITVGAHANHPFSFEWGSHPDLGTGNNRQI